MNPRSAEDQLDFEVLDAMTALFAWLVTEADRLAKDFDVPAFFMKALHLTDGPLAMKDLGKRMHCDPSFVTGIADMMEKRGLAVRESDPADRRVKRLVLTEAGLQLKQRMELQMRDAMPWRGRLTHAERVTLLGLIRKMAVPPCSATGASCGAEEVTGFLTTATPAS
jgi:DNA-binding MarR family transcriptional regulator